ncbi:hypothetical protein ACU8KH_03159 [Lachancea thermotolerans]
MSHYGPSTSSSNSFGGTRLLPDTCVTITHCILLKGPQSSACPLLAGSTASSTANLRSTLDEIFAPRCHDGRLRVVMNTCSFGVSWEARR